MSFYSTRSIDELSESEPDFEDKKMKPSSSRSKTAKRPIEKSTKINNKKIKHERKDAKKVTSYLEKVGDSLKTEKIEEEVINSVTFRQGDGLVTIRSPFTGKATDYWVSTHFKCSNIENIDLKNKWKHSECAIKLTTSDQDESQAVGDSLNNTIQTILDSFLQSEDKKISRINLSK